MDFCLIAKEVWTERVQPFILNLDSVEISGCKPGIKTAIEQRARSWYPCSCTALLDPYLPFFERESSGFRQMRKWCNPRKRCKIASCWIKGDRRDYRRPKEGKKDGLDLRNINQTSPSSFFVKCMWIFLFACFSNTKDEPQSQKLLHAAVNDPGFTSLTKWG